MSSTRTAAPGKSLRQERFASSRQYQRGLMANLVAKRCALLEDRSDIELIWSVQSISHEPGGLEQLAEEIGSSRPELLERVSPNDPRPKISKERLEALCLDPEERIERFRLPLREAILRRQQQLESSSVRTSVGKKVEEACRFALKTKTLVIVNGTARIGKTHAAKHWCNLNAGCARFAQVPSSSDEITFVRAMAESVGVSINLNSKAQQLRTRVEEVLQTQQLLLCLDEAHYLHPQSNYREALPHRINWLMTALSNYLVPIVLIVTPQFFSHQKRLEEKTFWTGKQFTGRVARYIELPDALPSEDLELVARNLLPEGSDEVIQAVARYARASAKGLAAIDQLITTARFFATDSGREIVSDADIKTAMREVMPSDRAIAAALAPKARRQAVSATPAVSLPPRGGIAAEPPQRGGTLPAEEEFPSRQSLVALG